MGEAPASHEWEGGRRADIRVVLPVLCAVYPYFWIRYVGGDSPHWEGPGGVPPSVHKVDNGKHPHK